MIDMFLEISKAEYLGDYRIRLWFNNGEVRIVDLANSLRGEAFLPLHDLDYFLVGQHYIRTGNRFYPTIDPNASRHSINNDVIEPFPFRGTLPRVPRSSSSLCIETNHQRHFQNRVQLNLQRNRTGTSLELISAKTAARFQRFS